MGLVSFEIDIAESARYFVGLGSVGKTPALSALASTVCLSN